MFTLRACLRGGGASVGSRSGASRIVSSSSLCKELTTSFSRMSMSTSTSCPSSQQLLLVSSTQRLLSIRPFSSTGNGDDDNTNNNNDKNDDDNFLLQDEDTLPKPPSYVRDAITGKWTNKTRAELTSKERTLLTMDEEMKSEEIVTRLGDRWKSEASKAGINVDYVDEDGGIDGLGTLNAEHERIARRIQEEQLALGPIGRDPSANIKRGDNEEDADSSSSDNNNNNIDRPLTPRELQALKTYAQKEHNVHPKDFARLTTNDPELIPHNTTSDNATAADSKQFFDADLDLAYLNPKLNRRAFKPEGSEHDDDPFADLLPSDLNPQRKVNRRHVKPLPRRVLHHNNLSLLRRYTTPGGKIMNRVQSRLGAKDQRKVAKLVKRARHLGLIPHLGQWKFEDHGNLHERGLPAAADGKHNGHDIDGKRTWELELEQRGLWPLQDDSELIKRYYDVEGIMKNIAGERGSKKRNELERLLGGVGGLVKEPQENDA